MLFGLSGLVLAAAALTPQAFDITNVSYAGPGCPAGSVAYDIAPDNAAFTFLFSQFTFETTSPNSSLALSCRITMTTNYTPGWSFQITSIIHRGFAQLEAGTIARVGHMVLMNNPGRGRIPMPQWSTITGPYAADFQVAARSASEWSPCVAARDFKPSPVQINSYLDFGPFVPGMPRGRGFIGIDSLDGTLSSEYQVQWRRCP